jgi:hypothetical protein
MQMVRASGDACLEAVLNEMTSSQRRSHFIKEYEIKAAVMFSSGRKTAIHYPPDIFVWPGYNRLDPMEARIQIDSIGLGTNFRGF